MDGPLLEQSDSDSGESWILLEEHDPAVADVAPGFSSHPHIIDREEAEHVDNDDTDGISIISDSDPESSVPCELINDSALVQVDHPIELHSPQFVSQKHLPSNNNDEISDESISGDIFLGDNHKLKTYVHKRNKRLSTVLNIIVLGSVITAAGVAIGHMWGARDECSYHTTPSVNKILSNLYKLQEENAYLRSIIKELTQNVNIFQTNQNKQDSNKFQLKQKCKKVFEESLMNKNINKFTKCVDNNPLNSIDKFTVQNHITEPVFEKEFLNDISKLKNAYRQNKSWLDPEIIRRLKTEENSLRIMKDFKSLKGIKIKDHKPSNNVFLKLPLDSRPESSKTESSINLTELSPEHPITDFIIKEALPEKQVSYADSLKQNNRIIQRRNIMAENRFNEHIYKKKAKKDHDLSESIVSDEDYKKDDRYVGHRHREDRKKQDRQKLHKKQKRRNKYEQWEMKGGYLKDFDELSFTSLHENEWLKKQDKLDLKSYNDKFSETDDSLTLKFDKIKLNQAKGDKKDDTNWFEKRASIRKQARKKLEQELFGENTPNNSGWYFRRMQRREQCRAKGDNSTYRKLTKHKRNYKKKN